MSVVQEFIWGPRSSLTETIASICLSSSHVQLTLIGILIVNIPSISSVDVQFVTSNSTIPFESSTTLHESPLSHLNAGSPPCELFSPIVASVTLSTRSPLAILTIKFLYMPSGDTMPPSKLASTTLVLRRYSISRFVNFTLPGVFAFTAIGISTSPTPLLGIC